MNTWLTSRFLGQKPNIGQPGLQNPGNSVHAAGAVECRNVAPYGVRYSAPGGTKMLILPVSDGSACMGEIAGEAQAGHPALAEGELSITMPSGACLHLKNDGTVVINRKVIIGADGMVRAKGFLNV